MAICYNIMRNRPLFGWWLGATRQQAITQIDVDLRSTTPDGVTISHNGLNYPYPNWERCDMAFIEPMHRNKHNITYS